MWTPFSQLESLEIKGCVLTERNTTEVWNKRLSTIHSCPHVFTALSPDSVVYLYKLIHVLLSFLYSSFSLSNRILDVFSNGHDNALHGEFQKSAAFAISFVDSDSQTRISLAKNEKLHITPYMNTYTHIVRRKATPYIWKYFFLSILRTCNG